MQERQTKQKQIIYESLRRLDHPTATEVYAHIREVQPTVSRATVFRVLSGFASTGRVKELRLAGSEMRYDYNTSPHYHAHCRACGRVRDVKIDGAPHPIDIALPSFSVEGYSIEFFGKCTDCAANV